MVSSGIYQRYFKVDDKIYHHILNPDTALPYDTDLYGVTITADKGHSADCDAMATICIALGKDKAREYIDSKDGYEALFVDDEGNVTYTDGFNYAK